jgi:hypothetical protein
MCIYYWRQERQAIAHLEAASRGLLDPAEDDYGGRGSGSVSHNLAGGGSGSGSNSTSRSETLNSSLVPSNSPAIIVIASGHSYAGNTSGGSSPKHRHSGAQAIRSNSRGRMDDNLLRKNHPHSGSWHRQPNEDDEMD